MGGLRNPTGGGRVVALQYLPSPEATAEIASLKQEVEELRARAPEIREVERVVVKDDPALLLKYNDALRELGKIRSDVAKGGSHPAALHSAPIEIREVVVEKIVEVERLVAAREVRGLPGKPFLIGILAAALALGIAIGSYATKGSAPRDDRQERTEKVDTLRNGSRGPLLKK